MPLYSLDKSDTLLRTSLDTNLGTPTETKAANADVTNKGLQGVLKGLWQTLLDRLPALVGGAIPVVTSSSTVAATITKSSVSVTTASQVLLAANTNRIGWVITNKSSSSGTAYIEFAGTATASDGLEVPPGYERTQDYAYSGVISVIGSAAHTLLVREFVK